MPCAGQIGILKDEIIVTKHSLTKNKTKLEENLSHDMNWDLMRCNEMKWWDELRFDVMRWDVRKWYERWWKEMRWNVMRWDETRWDDERWWDDMTLDEIE